MCYQWETCIYFKLFFCTFDKKWKTRLLRQIHTYLQLIQSVIGRKSCLYTILEFIEYRRDFLPPTDWISCMYIFGAISSSSILCPHLPKSMICMYIYPLTVGPSRELEYLWGVWPALPVPALDDDLVVGGGLQPEEVEAARVGEAVLVAHQLPVACTVGEDMLKGQQREILGSRRSCFIPKNRGLQILQHCLLKGTVSWDFLVWVFFMNQ